MMDLKSLDYMWLNRVGATVTKTVSHMLVPSTLQKNPAFETFIWLVECQEKLTLDEVIDFIKNFPQWYITWWKHMYESAPVHVVVETCMIVWIVWLLFIRKTADPKKKAKDTKLTEKEIKWLVKTWEPEPLVPELTQAQIIQNNNFVQVNGISGENGNYLKVDGVKHDVLNLGSFDFLGLSSVPTVKTNIRGALNKYGCGSCGPRGFYGTIDGDLLIMDEGCHEAIRTGARLSRSTVRTFKHNDTNDLRSILEGIDAEDRKKKRDAQQQRRFIVTEGLFRNTGEICALPSILALKEKFHYRMILDESGSFVVDHQRLSGPGYCFSASACPFLSVAATSALAHMENNAGLLADLEKNSRALAEGAAKVKGMKIKGKQIQPESPIIHLEVDPALGYSASQCKEIVNDIASRCLQRGSGIPTCKFSLAGVAPSLAPSIRLNSNACLTSAEIKQSIKDLSSSVDEALKAFKKTAAKK
eukprot:GSChrysophyteH2.ASY1.ANO1.1704.1 assembled CDS